MKKLLVLVLFWLMTMTDLEARESLKAGPMLGYMEMTETLIWVQTHQETTLKVKFWPSSSPREYRWSDLFITNRDNYYIAKVKLSQLKPGTVYNYEIYIKDQVQSFNYPLQFKTKSQWQFSLQPPDFKVALGSCVYINDPPFDPSDKVHGGGYHIFERIRQKKPEFMLWLGDNTYFRPADWYSKSQMNYRYSHTRSLKELQPFLASTPHYAIWDDHDYGGNDGDRTYRMREESYQLFKAYWGNQHYGLPDTLGIFSRFRWGDAEFFLLDNRYYRAPNQSKDKYKDYLGKKQLEWLKDSLVSSTATFKLLVIGNQWLNSYNPTEGFHTYEESKQLLNWLHESRIEGLIILSGDRHHSELFKKERWGGYPLLEFTVSPLTSKAYPPFPQEMQVPFRVPNTLYTKRNFGLIQFTGKKGQRNMTLELYSSKGQKIWDYSIAEQELKYY